MKEFSWKNPRYTRISRMDYSKTSVKGLRLILKDTAPKLKGIYKMKRDDLIKNLVEAKIAIYKQENSTTTLDMEILLMACPQEKKFMLRGVCKEMVQLIPLTDAQKALVMLANLKINDLFTTLKIIGDKKLNSHSEYDRLIHIGQEGINKLDNEEVKKWKENFRVGEKVIYNYSYIGEIIKINKRTFSVLPDGYPRNKYKYVPHECVEKL